MPKKIKNVPIEENQDHSSLSLMCLSKKTRKNKTKLTLKKDGQGTKDYFLYHSISKF